MPGIVVTPAELLQGASQVTSQGTSAIEDCQTSLAGAVTNLEAGASAAGSTASELLASWQGAGSNAYGMFQAGLNKDIALINAAMNEQVMPAVRRIQGLFEDLSQALTIAGNSYSGTDADVSSIFSKMAAGE